MYEYKKTKTKRLYRQKNMSGKILDWYPETIILDLDPGDTGSTMNLK